MQKGDANEETGGSGDDGGGKMLFDTRMRTAFLALRVGGRLARLLSLLLFGFFRGVGRGLLRRGRSLAQLLVAAAFALPERKD